MKPKSVLLAALALALLGQIGDTLATPPRDRAPPHKKPAAKRAPASPNGPLPCQVSINPKEDREIIILKLTQRLDCLENKVNYLSEQLSLQSHGAVQSFVEKPKEFVIKYPHDNADAP